MTSFRAFKADCWYGASGLRKTTNIGRCAERWMSKYGLKTRLVTADGGGADPVIRQIDAGIIELWPISLWPNRIETLDLASQGYWPKDLTNPGAGLHPPEALKDAKVGLLAIEGLTSFGSHVMQALKRPGVSLSQDPSYVLKDGGTSYAGGSMAAFGFVQDRIYDYVMKSHMVPYVHKVIWTALEGKGEEEGTKIPIFGPSIEGKKATGKAGQWFGNLIHMEAVAAEVKEDPQTKQLSIKTDIWAYLRPHADINSKIVFPAKLRAPYEFASEVPERVPPALEKVYDLLDEMRGRGAKPQPLVVGGSK